MSMLFILQELQIFWATMHGWGGQLARLREGNPTGVKGGQL